jgi:hypothetical protein
MGAGYGCVDWGFDGGGYERYGAGGEAENPRKESLKTQKGLPSERMGELSELDFLRKAMGMGMIVSKPWGDSYPYDLCATRVGSCGGRR